MYVYDCICIYLFKYILACIIPVVPARGGAEVALGLYRKTFFIYRTCMCHTPCASRARACLLCANVAHCSKCHTSNSTLHTLHSSHFALHTSHFTLHTPHFISSHLIWALLTSPHLISSLLICHLQVILNHFDVNWALLKLSHLTEALLHSNQLFCASESCSLPINVPLNHHLLIYSLVTISHIAMNIPITWGINSSNKPKYILVEYIS
jgi:hypothetical protein